MFNFNFFIMKTMFFKKMLPLVVVVATGVGGAFLTSMQKATTVSYRQGFVDGPNGPCTKAIDCDSDPGPLCRASYPNGQIAKGTEVPNCMETLYRPIN
jgi:hypothetical protein